MPPAVFTMLTPLESIPTRIEKLAAEGKLRAKTWSLPQIAEHLARTIEWQIGAIPEGIGPVNLPAMWKRRVFRLIFLGVGRLPDNVPTIDSIVPPDEVDLIAAVQRMRDAIDAMLVAPEPFRVHPFFGRMPRKSWIRFHEVHAEHHLKCVR